VSRSTVKTKDAWHLSKPGFRRSCCGSQTRAPTNLRSQRNFSPIAVQRRNENWLSLLTALVTAPGNESNLAAQLKSFFSASLHLFAFALTAFTG
jgi:hypothetical protein